MRVEAERKEEDDGVYNCQVLWAAFLERWGRQKREAETTSEINLKVEHGSDPGRGQNN